MEATRNNRWGVVGELQFLLQRTEKSSAKSFDAQESHPVTLCWVSCDGLSILSKKEGMIIIIIIIIINNNNNNNNNNKPNSLEDQCYRGIQIVQTHQFQGY